MHLINGGKDILKITGHISNQNKSQIKHSIYCLKINVKVKWSEVAQSCPTLCDPMNCSLPGSSTHGIFQARYWSGLPFPSPRDLPEPGIKPASPAL